MSNDQDQPLNNPFKNLDKSQYRDARQERRPVPLKIKKSDKARAALENSDEDALFAGLMRDSGVAPLEKGKHKTNSKAKTTVPHTAVPLAGQEPAPETVPAQAQIPTQIPAQTPKETPPRASNPVLSAPSRPSLGRPQDDDFEDVVLTLADHSAFAALKAQSKTLPRQEGKPVSPRIRQTREIQKIQDRTGELPAKQAELSSRPAPAPRAPLPDPAPAPSAAPAHQAVIPEAWNDAAQAFDDDADLFASAVSGARLLGGGGRAVAVPPPPRPLTGKEAPSDPLQDFMDGKVEFSLEFTDEYLQGHIVGLDAQIINKMKAGEFSSEAHIDLHGLNAMQAWEALVGFFRSAYHKGARCVLVVPGRGLNSPGGAGVLRERLQAWFTQAPFKYVILAFCTALPKHGGAGALYVLLRKQKKTRGKIRWDILPADADLFGDN